MAPVMKDFHLSISDQTMLRMYVRHLILFPFPDPKHSKDAIRALRAALHATLIHLPFLAGTIKPLHEGVDRLGLQYPDPVSDDIVNQIFTAGFESAENKELEYGGLERAGFPPSKLPRDAFCPDLLKNHAGLDDAFAEGLVSFKTGHPVPVFASRATFIHGGLVLSVYSNHSVVDGNGIAQIYQIWSANIRSQIQATMPNSLLGSLNTPAPASQVDTNLDSKRHLLDSLAEATESMDCPEVRFPGTPSRAPTLRSTPYNLDAKIFVFPAVTIAKLIATLSSATNTRISSFTALVALLWTQITVVRSPSIKGKKIEDTKLCIAYDHRKNLDQEFSGYLGNCATGMLVTSPLATMPLQSSSSIDADALIPIALNITQTLSSITLDWLKARLSLFSRSPNSYQLSMDLDIPNGPDLFVTSWMYMGADCVWNIPGSTSQVPKAIRKPQSKVEGNIHILPRAEKDDASKVFEVLVCLEEGEMERVVKALEKGEWVERVVDA